MTPLSKAPESSGKAVLSHETPETVPTPVPAPKTRQKRRKKNPSRADRCGEACAMLDDAENEFQSVSDEIMAYLEEQDTEGAVTTSDHPFRVPDVGLVADWQERINRAAGQASDARSELDNLKDEIDNWKDNMPESLQSGEKYSTLESTSDALDTAINALNDDEPTLTDTGDSKTDWEAVAEVVARCADTCNEARTAAEDAEFPGMFG